MDDAASEVIGQLYDAAIDPRLWSGALRSVDDFVGTAQSFIAIEDAADPVASVFHASIHDPDWLRRYATDYMMINPMRLAMTGRVKTGDVVLTKDFMTAAEYGATRFSRELLAERRIVDIAVIVLELTATRISVLSTQRSREQGFADEVLRRKLHLIMPHAQRAVRIARLLEHADVTSSNFAATLDRLAASVFLVTASGDIVHANARAVTTLEEGKVARSVRGKLALFDRRAGAAVAQLLEDACGTGLASCSRGPSIPLTGRDDRKFVATVALLHASVSRPTSLPHHAVAAVCIKEAEFDLPPSDYAPIAALHDLTPREVTVLSALVELGSIPEVADAMGVGESTVRSHVKSLYRKTGAHRQADLVKMMASIASPLRS